MNILIPMAGQGSRFQQAGYSFPKPLIDVNHRPMIQVVTDNLSLVGRHVFLVLKDHYDKYSLRYLLPLIVQPNECEIIQVDRVTEGAACTALLARDLINNDDELVIANSDQWIDWDSRHFLAYMRARHADGGILTFFSTHPKWSFVRVDELSSRITEVAEKRPISNVATVGIYYFRRGRDFVAAADRMIQKNIRVNNEFYVAPTFNEMIADGKTIHPYPVAEMKGLGTPEDLERFLTTSKSTARAGVVRLVILIAHRGNTEGRKPSLENKPVYLDAATAAGYDVEVDVWFQNEHFFLGHDAPETPTSLTYLSHPKFWLHAKNLDALVQLRQANLHCFFHDSDDATLTSRGYIWTYPGKPLTPLSICVMPERPDGLFSHCAGVCSDVVKRYRH